MFSCILFDLDGTISDPKQGICGCVQYALRSFGIEEPELDRLEPFIGPPLAESFMKYYNFTAEQAQEAVEKYRERFSVTGKYENVLYPGMGALLHDLKASGATLAIASSKPTVAPSCAKAKARLTAVVLLPTPPLPEATAMMFFTPGNNLTPS